MKELTIQEFKEVQLDILCKVHEFCEANDIRYSLAYGTLIGAIRHQGYIPWDDDIDICMLREDYNKFISSFNDYACGFKVRSLETDCTYSLPFAKIESLNTKVLENSNTSMQIGVNIDLFPIDGICDEKGKREIFYKKLKRRHSLHTLKCVKIAPRRSLLKNTILFLSQTSLSWISIRKLAENIDKYIDKKNKTSQTVCEQAQCTYGLKSCFPRKCMDSFIPMKFEDKLFYVMGGYHEYLSRIYGDYMQLPPLEKQITHHSLKAYKLK